MGQDNQPVQSPVMFVYSEGSSYQYPRLAVPPVAHAPLREETTSDGIHKLSLNYGGIDVITFEISAEAKLRYRKGSDGNVQSSPLIQQFGISSDCPVKAKVTIKMRQDGFCMKPRRAVLNEAILGQHGHPLIYGANGFYGVWEDLLLQWYGADWNWIGEVCSLDKDGSISASFELLLTAMPFIILLSPRYYGQHLGYRHFKPWEKTPNQKAISGWCSWEAYHDNVTEQNIFDAADKMAELVSHGLEYIQLDDGYEQILIPPTKNGKVYESWLKPNEKFPNGHEALVSYIKAKGIVPGIWTNAVVTNEEAANTNDLCMQENGDAFRGQWIQFILTCTEKTLKEHVLPYYIGLKEKGYRYFKTDALRHLIFDGLQECVRRGLLTDEAADEKYRAFFKTIREGIGDDTYLLSCWGALGQCIGLADACRVATDANPNWAAIQMQIAETARCFFAQRVLYTLDPDHICIRTKLEYARMLLSFVSLTGGLYMLSDPLECYDDIKMEMIRKTLPAQEIYTAETGVVDYTTPAFYGLANSSNPEEYSKLTNSDSNGDDIFGTLWATHYAAADRRWTVAMRSAISPLKAAAIPLSRLGIQPGRKYAFYDFWHEEFLGCSKDNLPMHALALGEVQVVSIVPVTPYSLTLLGSTRHVSMDTVSVKEFLHTNEGIAVSLSGIPGECIKYALYGEGDWKVQNCLGGSVELVRVGEIIWMTVKFDYSSDELTVELSL